MSTWIKGSLLHKVYFLHGFSGDPEDWKEVIDLLPEFECIALTYPFQIPTDGILVGYSMGGRIALGSTLPKINISGHPGLLTEEEKKARVAGEQLWLQKLKTLPIRQFFEEWYAQPLLESLHHHPKFPKIFERRLRNNLATLMTQFEMHSLVHQSSSLQNTQFMHGEYDQKYKELYEKRGIYSHEVPKSGHACHLENPACTARQIKILIDSIN
jgi:2-succinyl-6-hydroxy-2,4-cyclohexadiene-1-carboxylate synthase